jgi:hypothetical protein
LLARAGAVTGGNSAFAGAVLNTVIVGFQPKNVPLS